MSTLTITLIQTDLHWENKSANRQMLEEKIRSIREKTEVIVLPEMFNTGFSMNPVELAESMDGETVQWMKALAAEKNVILAGSLIIEEKGHFYNRLVWMLPNGQYGVYDKRHRFGYAGEDQQFTAGTKRLIASVKGWKINLQICYDLRFPIWSRQGAVRTGDTGAESALEYDVLIYVANWPDRRNIAWKTLLQARAIENQCYVVGVNRVGKDGHGNNHTGDSMVIDPLGAIMYHKAEEEDVFTLTLERSHLAGIREKLPFWRDSDNFVILSEEK